MTNANNTNNANNANNANNTTLNADEAAVLAELLDNALDALYEERGEAEREGDEAEVAFLDETIAERTALFNRLNETTNETQPTDPKQAAIEALQAAVAACTAAGVFVAMDDGCSGFASKLGEVYRAGVDVNGETQTAVLLAVEPEAYDIVDEPEAL